MLEQSILTSIKKLLGQPEELTDFDMDITLHINSAFSTLNSLGVGPDKPFSIEDKSAKWADFIGDAEYIDSVKTYVNLDVRIVFDPPQNSATLQAFQTRRDELGFRLQVASEQGRIEAARVVVVPDAIVAPEIFRTGVSNG